MSSPTERTSDALRKLVRRQWVVELEALFDLLGTRSRMTVFRRLKEVGYRSSFTHAGRYYTLADLPDFDALGLWFYRDIGFSRAGTLKQTVPVHVEEAPDGRTHAELERVLHVRVHNTLLDLIRKGRIGRQRFAGVQLYVSADSARASEQMARRAEVAKLVAEVVRVLSTEETVEVLVEALRAAPTVPPAPLVAARLAARGIRIEARHVQQAYETYGLEPRKKTPGSRPSPP